MLVIIRFCFGSLAGYLLVLGASTALAQAVPLAQPDLAAEEIDKTIDFAADRVEFDQLKDIVSASGDVRLQNAGYLLRAGRVIWNRKTGVVTADGQVSIRDPSGDIAFSDTGVLNDTLTKGAVENLLVVIADGGRLAAKSGQYHNGDADAQRATYSPCAVTNDDGCPKHPSWLITAQRVSYDHKLKKVRYHNARIEVFGLPVLPLPYFWHSVSDAGASGLLGPIIDTSSNNGLSVGIPYYIRLSDRRDLTLTPFLFSASPPALEANFRALNAKGAIDVTTFVTASSVTPIDVANGTPKELFRGYFDATGRYQLSPEWDIHGSIRVATDRTLLNNYQLSTDDRLRSNVTVERISPTSYFSVQGWAVETLRPLESQALAPIALPEIDYRKRFENSLLDGTLNLQLNSLAIARSAGQDTQRAFAGFEWTKRALTPLGQELLFTAYGRGDVYHSSENAATTTAIYQGLSGWQTRAIGALAAEMRWPLIGEGFGGTIRFTPRVQVVASPPTANLSIPNEDARAIELDDTNLFALNRFPGYDRWEDGARVTYGADWALDRPNFAIDANIGQSYRFNSAGAILPDGTGLASRVSDIVGRTTIKFRDIITLNHRYRLDKDNLAVRRNEVDTTLGGSKTYFTISYLKLNRHINANLEDLQDHEEVRVGGRIQLAKHWSISGSTIVDLTTKKLDPLSVTDGFSPVRHRFGFLYEDDCISLGLSWRRDFSTTLGTQTGNHFKLTLVLRNLGR